MSHPVVGQYSLSVSAYLSVRQSSSLTPRRGVYANSRMLCSFLSVSLSLYTYLGATA
jgi:hypothetical protein